MGQCPNCEKMLNVGWVVCLHCGWRVNSAMNSKPPSLEIAKPSACGSCGNNCSNENYKPKKSKCCKRYLNKKKSKGKCKSCPEILSVVA